MALWSIFHDGIGDISSSKLVKIVKKYDIKWLFSASEITLKKELFELDKNKIESFIKLRNTVDIVSRIDFLKANRIKISTYGDQAYPRKLLNIYDPPGILYFRGGEFCETLYIGIVGSRMATSYGKAVALNISENLSYEGICIVSGLAKGIDAKAHEGALKGSGGTIGVLGTGLNIIYPKENARLYSQLLDHPNSLILSEYPLNEAAKPYHFPRRNRILSGLSDGILVVEAADKSGALITANLAMEEGKDVFAVPGLITSKASVGCHRLIKDGAKLVSNTMDILEEYGQLSLFNQLDLNNKNTMISLNDDEKLVYAAIEEVPITMEEIVLKVDIPIHKVMSILSWLEINDLIEQLLGRQYIRKSQN